MSFFHRVHRFFWLSLAISISLTSAILFQTNSVAHAQTCPLETGKPYRSAEVATVYLVTPECTKRPFFNPDVYLSFFVDWNKVTFVDQATLDSVPNDVLQFLPWGPNRDFQTGSIIKITSDPTVYLISNGKAYPIVSEQVFTSLGLSFKDIEDVAAATLAKYPIQSSSIQAPTDVPPSIVFKYPGNPDLYELKIENGQLVKAHIETMDVLRALARADRIIIMPTDMTFPDAAEAVIQPVDSSTTSTDSIAPTVTDFVIPATSTSRTISILSFVATDNVAVTGYRITDSTIVPSSTASGWSSIATSTYMASVAMGTKTLYAWAKDAAGNVSRYKAASTIFASSTAGDVIAPTVTFFSIPATSTSRVVPISSFTATDNVGVTGYKITDGTSIPSATASGWSSIATTTYTFGDTSGTRTLYAWAKDAAGNVSRYKSAATTWAATSTGDTVAPTVTSFSIPATSTSRVVPISSFTATDNIGVTGYLITDGTTIPSVTISGWTSTPTSTYAFSVASGTRTLYAWAKDAAGNVSRYKTASTTFVSSTTSITGDVIAPVVTSFTIPEISTFRIVPISSFTATDNIGVTGYIVTESSVTPSLTNPAWKSIATSTYAFSVASGTKSLYAWVKDAAGNISSYRSAATTWTATSTGDTVVPTVTSFSIPATSTSRIVPITTFTAVDNVGVTGYIVTESSVTPSSTNPGWSSIATTTFAFPNTLGTRNLYAWARDAAGNISNRRSATTTLGDLTAPVVASFTIPTTSASRIVSISSFTATDNVGVTGYLVTESNVIPSSTNPSWRSTATTTYTFSVASGTKTLYAWAKDAAGNISSSKSATTTLAVSVPVISAVSSSVSSSTSVTITWATDQLSTSTVQYGFTTSYGKLATSPVLTTEHSIDLNGLSATSTMYHFRVSSQNSDGGVSYSGDNVFQTSPLASANLWFIAYNLFQQIFFG